MTGSTDGRAAWLHAALVVVVVAFVVLAVPSGPWRPAVELVIFGLGVLAVRVALRRHRSPAVVAWYGLGGALLFFGASCLAEVPALLGIAEDVFAPLESGLDLAAYGFLVVAGLGILRGGSRRRDREAWIDTATLLLAAGLTVLAFVGRPDEAAPGLIEYGIGVPVLTAVLLIVCLPLAVSRGARSVSTMALLVAGVLTVIGYGGRIVAPDSLRATGMLDVLPLLAVAAVTLATRHPSAASAGRRPESEQEATTGRVLGLGAALLISPALLVLWSIRNGGGGYLLGAGSALLTGLALWRLTGLNRERERARAAVAAGELRLRLLLENAADVIAIIDADGRISYISPAVETLLGRPPADYVGRRAFELCDPQDQARLRLAVARAEDAADVGPVDVDVRLLDASGGTRWVELRISARLDAVGIEGWVVNMREVTDRKLFEDELRRQASTDGLTGLLNRKAFAERLASATRHLDPGAPPAVLFVDVDDFKAVNDSLGHAAGDELLAAIAGRLAAGVRADDVVGRLGGDEFALLLPSASPERLRDVADRVLAAIRTPVQLAAGTVEVTGSVGGALAAPGCTAEQLLHRADTAMYRAKRAGKNSVAVSDLGEPVLLT